MNILKQYDIKRIGSLIHVVYFTMPLFGVISYGISAITMYTVILPYIKPSFPWLTLPMFIGCCLALCITMLIIFYKFIYHSYFEFQNKQEYLHNNLIRQDLEAIKKKLEAYEKQNH